MRSVRKAVFDLRLKAESPLGVFDLRLKAESPLGVFDLRLKAESPLGVPRSRRLSEGAAGSLSSSVIGEVIVKAVDVNSAISSVFLVSFKPYCPLGVSAQLES